MKNTKPMPKLIRTSLIFFYIDTHHITRKEFCEQCGISLSTFYRIINGKDFKIPALYKISKVLDVPLYTLFEKAEK